MRRHSVGPHLLHAATIARWTRTQRTRWIPACPPVRWCCRLNFAGGRFNVQKALLWPPKENINTRKPYYVCTFSLPYTCGCVPKPNVGHLMRRTKCWLYQCGCGVCSHLVPPTRAQASCVTIGSQGQGSAFTILHGDINTTQQLRRKHAHHLHQGHCHIKRVVTKC